MTTRRGFFGSLAGLAAGMTLDPERALWIPGAKLVSIPRVIVRPPTERERLTVDTALRLLGLIGAHAHDLAGSSPSLELPAEALWILRAKRDTWGLGPPLRHIPLDMLSTARVIESIYLAGELAPMYAAQTGTGYWRQV